jgi:hypothetical protein
MEFSNFRAKNMPIANPADLKRKFKKLDFMEDQRNVVLRHNKHDDHFWVNEKLDGFPAWYSCASTRFKKESQFWYIGRSYAQRNNLKKCGVLNGYNFFGEVA